MKKRLPFISCLVLLGAVGLALGAVRSRIAADAMFEEWGNEAYQLQQNWKHSRMWFRVDVDATQPDHMLGWAHTYVNKDGESAQFSTGLWGNHGFK
jgi:hypothetical protein